MFYLKKNEVTAAEKQWATCLERRAVVAMRSLVDDEDYIVVCEQLRAYRERVMGVRDFAHFVAEIEAIASIRRLRVARRLGLV